MNEFETMISGYMGETSLNKIRGVKIGIAGAGGLGSNCAANLVRTGFGRFKIVDHDIIVLSNLNRQFYFHDQIGMKKVEALDINLKRINPVISTEMIVEKIQSGRAAEIFGDCDIIVEAFDKAEYKRMLAEELLAAGKTVVSASGLAGFGSSDDIKIHRFSRYLTVVGDLVSDVKDLPPLSPRVSVAAAKQAEEVLTRVLGK